MDARISSKVTVDKAIPDRRVMEEYLAVTSSSGVRDALLDAQNVIDDAWSEPRFGLGPTPLRWPEITPALTSSTHRSAGHLRDRYSQGSCGLLFMQQRQRQPMSRAHVGSGLEGTSEAAFVFVEACRAECEFPASMARVLRSWPSAGEAAFSASRL